MDARGNFYELTADQRKALAGDGYEGAKVDGENYETLQQDVARLDGYLKARAEVDRLKRDLSKRGGGNG